MAKPKTVDTNLFASTARPRKQVIKAEKVPPVSVGLSAADLARLEEIAAEMNQTRHAIMKYAIRDFIRRYDQGDRPKTKTVTIKKEVFDLE